MLKGIRSKSIELLELEDYDVIWVMERRHTDAFLRLESKPRVEPSLFDPEGDEVDDPYFQSKAAVRDAFEMLNKIALKRSEELSRWLR